MENDILFKNYQKYLVPLIFVVIIVLTFFLLKPYFIAILWALFLTYLFYPVYKRLKKYIKNETLTSAIVTILIALVILIPVYLIVSIILKESFNIYSYIRTSDVINVLANYNINIAPYLNTAIENVTTFSLEVITQFIISVPKKILELFIILFLSFYLFRAGPTLIDNILNHLPKKVQAILKKNFIQVSSATVHGHILTALIQTVIGTLGLIIFQVPNPFLWGFVMFLAAMIPYIGPAIIWLPASVYLYLSGKPTLAISLFIYGLLLVSTIDNIIKPKLIGKKADLHPAVILLGILGGLSLFGLIGLFIGPLVLALFISLVKVYFGKDET